MPGWRKPGRSGSAPLSPLFTGLNKGPVGRKLVQALGRVQEFAPSSAVEENVYYMCVYCPDLYLLMSDVIAVALLCGQTILPWGVVNGHLRPPPMDRPF